MDTPGKLLKAEREKRKILLEELAEVLKIKTSYLKAIEDEDYQSIPGEVFVKGYIRAYANTLCIDSNYILNLYKKQIARDSQTEGTVATSNGAFSPLEKNLFGANLRLTGLTHKSIFIIASAFILFISLIIFITREEKKPDQPSGMNLINAQKELPEIKRPQVVTEKESEIRTEQERLSLKIDATELTWISVSIDSSMPVVRFLEPGEVMEWTALKGFSIRIGNAGGVKIAFNGKDLGNLGPHGKVVKLFLPEDKGIQENGR